MRNNNLIFQKKKIEEIRYNKNMESIKFLKKSTKLQKKFALVIASMVEALQHVAELVQGSQGPRGEERRERRARRVMMVDGRGRGGRRTKWKV